MARINIFLIIIALIAGMIGCVGGNGNSGDSYTLIVDFTAGGTVTIDDVPIPGKAILTYDAGTVVNLNAIPSADYRFVNWTGDVSTIADVEDASTTIIMDAAKSVTADFAPLRCNLIVDSTDGGSVSNPGEGTSTYDYGTVVDLVAAPDNGYRFVEWTGNVSTIDDISAGSTTITMDDDYSITANFIEQGAIYFSDPNLEAAIREEIEKLTGDIYPSDLEGLTSLDASARNIADVTALEHCTSLTELCLDDNQISDVSPLANLINLASLYLDHNQMSDISGLGTLMGLTYLALSGNQVSDISALANLANLTGLDLGDNQISDMSALAALTELTYLALSRDQVSDISALVGLANLADLYLDGNHISDIYPLVDNEGLSEGDDVYLQGNPLSSDSINIYIPELESRGVEVHY